MSALADRWKFMSKAEVDFIPAIQVTLELISCPLQTLLLFSHAHAGHPQLRPGHGRQLLRGG